MSAKRPDYDELVRQGTMTCANILREISKLKDFTMTTQHIDEMREAFEKWYSGLSQYLDGPWTRKMAAQDAWQAATASAEAKYAKVVELLQRAKLFSAHNFDCEYHNGGQCSCGSYEFYKDIDKALAAPLLKGEK